MLSISRTDGAWTPGYGHEFSSWL